MDSRISKFLSQYGMIFLMAGMIIGASVAHKQKSLSKLGKTTSKFLFIPLS